MCSLDISFQLVWASVRHHDGCTVCVTSSSTLTPSAWEALLVVFILPGVVESSACSFLVLEVCPSDGCGMVMLWLCAMHFPLALNTFPDTSCLPGNHAGASLTRSFVHSVQFPILELQRLFAYFGSLFLLASSFENAFSTRAVLGDCL